MENRNPLHHGQTNAALPTTFVSADESAELTKMLELEFDQVREVAGGAATVVRCCACHCCSVHKAN